jgi:hypothetical protein
MRYLLMTVFGALALVAMSMYVPSSVMAAEKEMHAGKAMMMEGYIIDSACATANKDKLDEYVKVHPKECAMKPACRKSGYNFYSDGKLWKLDKASNDKVYKFLEKSDSKLHVKAEILHGKGDMNKIVSITNAE